LLEASGQDCVPEFQFAYPLYQSEHAATF
jgi:hypothetical protein